MGSPPRRPNSPRPEPRLVQAKVRGPTPRRMWSMQSSRPDEPTEQTQSGNSAAADPQAELGRLKAELGREHDMYLRALADFENYRGRVDRERTKAADSRKRELILPLLDVVHWFDPALAHGT